MSAAPALDQLLTVDDLHVEFGHGSDAREVVKGVSFAVAPGECLAIVGESGSGKSVTARTLVGLTGRHARVRAGGISLGDRSLLGLRDRDWRRLRGKRLGLVLQDALVSLDGLRSVGSEIAEPLRLHGWGTRAERRDRVIELLRDVGVPEPELRAAQLPHELSGGLRQRALIASAIALDPELVIADEPTTALDVTVQAQVLALLGRMKERGRGLIVISHDLAVVAQLADTVAVMRDGVFVEHGPAASVLGRPEHPYTRALLEAIPSTHSKGTRLSAAPVAAAVGPPRRQRPAGAEVVISADRLVKRFRGPDGVSRAAVDGVSLELRAGETLGVVGESGSGKTTTARLILALADPDEGAVELEGQPWSQLSETERRSRRREIAVIYQDPLSSFDPRWTVERIVADALPETISGGVARRDRVLALLDQVGLEESHLRRKPLRLSGGQRQRVAIARALACEPAVIVCDEPVSALDVTIQAQVLDLLTDLQAAHALSYLFISHDLGVIHHMSDRVVVMRDGRIVEQGTAHDIFHHPEHPYTQQLLAALPDAVPAPSAEPQSLHDLRDTITTGEPA